MLITGQAGPNSWSGSIRSRWSLRARRLSRPLVPLRRRLLCEVDSRPDTTVARSCRRVPDLSSPLKSSPRLSTLSKHPSRHPSIEPTPIATSTQTHPSPRFTRSSKPGTFPTPHLHFQTCSQSNLSITRPEELESHKPPLSLTNTYPTHTG